MFPILILMLILRFHYTHLSVTFAGYKMYYTKGKDLVESNYNTTASNWNRFSEQHIQYTYNDCYHDMGACKS